MAEKDFFCQIVVVFNIMFVSSSSMCIPSESGPGIFSSPTELLVPSSHLNLNFHPLTASCNFSCALSNNGTDENEDGVRDYVPLAMTRRRRMISNTMTMTKMSVGIVVVKMIRLDVDEDDSHTTTTIPVMTSHLGVCLAHCRRTRRFCRPKPRSLFRFTFLFLVFQKQKTTKQLDMTIDNPYLLDILHKHKLHTHTKHTHKETLANTLLFLFISEGK